jgi:hypothetical protein
MKKIIALIILSLFAACVFAQTTTTTGVNSLGTASSGLNYAPVSNYTSPEPRPNTVIAPNINPTVNCANTASGGVAFGGVQIVGGGSNKDEDCSNKELIKMTYAMGDQASAFDMECDMYPAYRKTRLRQGRPCLADVIKKADIAVAIERPDLKDSIVRARNNLPPIPQ